MKRLILFIAHVFISVACLAQGIKGRIVDELGEPMPNASIYIKEAGTGTASNENGFYELRLPSGTYEVTFQFIGYAARTFVIKINKDFVEKDVQLTPQSITLNTVNVTGEAEDPAYTIMRKAIAKAKFHRLQIDQYTATVYTKGSGQISSIPWPFKKMAAEEGMETDRVYTSESVSEVLFERPNTFKEKVISIRASGPDDENANPNAYFNASFYVPKVVNSISPLAPSAFSYYRFKFLGTFVDRGNEVNKIQVIPRSKGENVFEGVIYIRENYWNIHSLDLKTAFEGFDVYIEKVYGPIQDKIWLPVTQKIAFNGSILGVGFNYKYLASVSNYQVTPNPDLTSELVVLDETIDPIPEEIIEEEKSTKKEDAKEVIKEDDKKITRKQLAKMVDEYEDQERKKEKEEQDIVSDRWYKVDTAATKKDSAYWANIRPVPLTKAEVDGYKKADSTYVAVKADSLAKKDGSSFNAGDIFFGNTYKLGTRLRFAFPGFLPNFRYNTVEGFNLDFTGTFKWKNDTTLRLQFTPNIRYGFTSTNLYATLKTSFGFGKYPHRSSFVLQGGKYINQFYKNSINQHINSIWSLFFARNYMKLYDQTFGAITFYQQMGYKVNMAVNVAYASRNELFNNTSYSFFRPGENWYSPNRPQNIETTVGGFNDNRALKTAIHLYIQPWLKFGRYNGRRYPITTNAPQFRLSYFSGWNDVLESTTDFQRIELGVKAAFELGVKATFDFDAEIGTFLSNNSLEFMDFKHFDGGLTEIAPMSVTGNYRLLDYYIYSTQKSYISLFTHIRFRKFLFTHIPLVRISGVRENLFVNYLKTDFSPNYWEVGYTIDKIFRAFRLEFVQSFNNGTPLTFGVRIGVSTAFLSSN